MLQLLLIALAFLELSLAAVHPSELGNSQKPSTYEVCKVGDKQSCSGRGSCQAYARGDGHRATRCACDAPYTGTKCETKGTQKQPSKLQAAQKKIVIDDSSSSSSSDSEVDDSSSEVDESESSSEVIDEPEWDGSSSGSDSSDWEGSNSNRRHHAHRRSDTGQTFLWTVIIAFVVLVFICCCLGGVVYWSRRV